MKFRIKELISSLSSVKTSKEKIDLSSIKWVTPFLILPLASQITKIKTQHPDVEIIYPRDEAIQNYLEAIIFPRGTSDLYTIKYGKTYLPITRITRTQNLYDESLNASISKYERLAIENLITEQQYRQNISEALGYFISEMVDNVQQHSEAEELWIMGQCWPKSGELEFCLLDDGIGFRGAYEKANIPTKTDLDALDKATKGISAKKNEGRGFGIRTSVRLMTQSDLKGEFLIISGSAGYYSSYGNTPVSFNLPSDLWHGVIISARICKPLAQIDIYKYIE